MRAARVLGERHLKLELQDGDGAGCAKRSPSGTSTTTTRREVQPDARVELAYRLDVNQYNGLERLQLVVEYLRVLWKR